jgi:hypothetical protein
MKKSSLVLLALFAAFTMEAAVAQTGSGSQTQPKKPATGTTAQQQPKTTKKHDTAKNESGSAKGSKHTKKAHQKRTNPVTPADTKKP